MLCLTTAPNSPREQKIFHGQNLFKMIRCCVSFSTVLIRKLSVDLTNPQNIVLLSPNIVQANFARNSGTSFFCKLSADHLWGSATGVSNPGRKRGRGKGRRVKRDLNKGQVIGIGPANIQWPGLSAPVLRGKELVKQVQLPPDPEREARLIQFRDQMRRFKPLALTPLERGWTGGHMGGRKVGPPDPIGHDKFEGFETVILEMKTVCSSDGNIGKVRRFSCMCCTGNKQGLIGFGNAKGIDGRPTIKRAKNRAGQKLLYVQKFNDRTVFHDFFTRFGSTKIFVHKKPDGYGLVCHRVIKSICELIGIKDLYAKVEGSTNVKHIARAFLLGLLRQKTHQAIAESKGLYVVEQRQENHNFPIVLGVPGVCRTEKDVSSTETMDFSQYAMDDQVPYLKKRWPPFFVNHPGWQLYLQKTERYRNEQDVRVRLLAEYGGTTAPRSHLTKQYPECDGSYGLKLKEKKDRERAAAEAAADED